MPSVDRVVPLGHVAERVLRPRHDRPVVVPVERPVVDPLGLEEDHRVVVLDRRDQQALGVVRVRHDDRLQAGHVGEQRLGALRVGLPAEDAAAGRHADRERRGEVAGRAVAQARRLGHDLVVRRVHVVGELDLDARPQPVRRHADRGADDAGLVDRCVEAAVLAEALLQALRATEHAAEVADVLAEHDHASRRAPSRPTCASRIASIIVIVGIGCTTCSRCSRRWRGIVANTSSNIVAGLGIAPLFTEPWLSASSNAACDLVVDARQHGLLPLVVPLADRDEVLGEPLDRVAERERGGASSER